MKVLNPTYLILFFCTSITPNLAAQNWTDLDFKSPAPTSNWQYMRTPPTNGPVSVDDQPALYLAGPFSNYNSGAVNQTVAFTLDRLQQYRVSAQVKTKGTTGRGASLYAYGKAGEEIVGYVDGGYLSGDNDWQTVSITFIGDNRIDSVRIGCYLEGEGEAWFRSIRWEAIPISPEETSPRVTGYLDTFFQIIKDDVLYPEQQDFPTLRHDVDILVAGAQKTTDTHDALNYILRRINKHSFLIPTSTADAWNGTEDGEESQEPMPIEVAMGKRINDEIAYLTVPQLGSGHEPTLRYYADTLQSLIASLDTDATKGWVVDLRANGGGNCWPMLAGIGPLLGEGVCGYFIAPNGDNPQAWKYENGSSYQDSLAITTLSGTPYQLKKSNPKIAVLFGPSTASSGEITAIAFIDRPNTKSFGEPTAGYSTTNQNYTLSDGAIMLLTVSVYADRNKNVLPLKVTPDVIIESDSEEDKVLMEAVKWLEGE